MNAIRALLVDDEEPARLRLRGMLADFDDVEIVGEAGDGDEARETIRRERPDLLFLDIQMPGRSGLEVAAALEPPRPRIIFCTAFDHYAIEAFEHHATDYLLKPVNRRRLAKAIERVRADVTERRARARETSAASETQARLLPQTLPPMANLDYAGMCRAARGVGGDYYDFIDLGPGRLGIALGDVSGKGMFAGLLVAGLQARVQSLAPGRSARVADSIAEINRRMHAVTDSNRYATLFYAAWDDAERALTWVNAGHNPPLLVRRRGGDPTLTSLAASGPPVGLLADATYAEHHVRLDSGDLLLIHTDGVTEATNEAGDEFGVDRLQRAIRERLDLDAASLRDAVAGEVERFRGGADFDDDLTLVVARAR